MSGPFACYLLNWTTCYLLEMIRACRNREDIITLVLHWLLEGMRVLSGPFFDKVFKYLEINRTQYIYPFPSSYNPYSFQPSSMFLTSEWPASHVSGKLGGGGGGGGGGGDGEEQQVPWWWLWWVGGTSDFRWWNITAAEWNPDLYAWYEACRILNRFKGKHFVSWNPTVSTYIT